MPTKPSVIVDPLGEDGSRRVRIEGLVVGVAYGLWDMVVLLHRAGLDWDEDEIAHSDRIEWRGGGPDEWD